MRSYLPLVIMLVLIGVSGYVHGVMTDRWGIPADVTAAAKRLERVPDTVGEWQSIELAMDSRELEVAEAQGHLARRYTNPSTGRAVDVLILCGRPGPISVHEPTTCFIGAGYALHNFEDNVPVPISGTDATVKCRLGDFVKGAEGNRIGVRTFWTWTADGRWQSPSNPRITFARSPHLYKMYLSRSASVTDEDSTAEDPLVEFMHEFLPALNQTLFEET